MIGFRVYLAALADAPTSEASFDYKAPIGQVGASQAQPGAKEWLAHIIWHHLVVGTA